MASAEPASVPVVLAEPASVRVASEQKVWVQGLAARAWGRVAAAGKEERN